MVEHSAGFEAVLTVRGDVDVRTSAEFEERLALAIGRGHRSVVLDLAGLEFMDASGLHVIARQAERLTQAGGALTIRSPSRMIRQLLDVVELSNLVRFDPPETSSSRLSSEEAVEAQGLSASLRVVTAVPSGEEVVDRALQLVVALARKTVGGADGVSVSLRRRGLLSTVAASDQTIVDMDAGQYQTGEGPCVDASNTGRGFHAPSLATEERWPAFTPKALDLGINAILSTPLAVRDRPVGALNIYSRRVAAFAPVDQELASEFATQTSIILTSAGVDVTDTEMATRFQEALRTRELIAHAEGIIMERDGVGEDGAHAVLRRLAVGDGQPLRERAEGVVASARRSNLGPTGGAPEGTYG